MPLGYKCKTERNMMIVKLQKHEGVHNYYEESENKPQAEVTVSFEDLYLPVV